MSAPLNAREYRLKVQLQDTRHALDQALYQLA